MKNLIPLLFLSFFALSCSKQEYSEAKKTLNTADSLFAKANDGLKTLDSISKRLNDSNGVARKVLAPKIRQQTKRIDSTLSSGKWQLDSMRKEINKVAQNVKVGSDVAKTLDSASQMIRNGENAIAVLSKTADKILNQSKNIATGRELKNSTSDTVGTTRENNQFRKNSAKKEARLEINVDDLPEAKSLVLRAARDYDANIRTEKYSNVENIQKEQLSMEVPSANFRAFVDELSSGIGDVKAKDISQGSVIGEENDIAKVELILKNEQTISTYSNVTTDTPDREKILEEEEIAVEPTTETESTLAKFLPFLPLFLLCVIIILVIKGHNNKRKGYIDVEKPAEERDVRPQDRTMEEEIAKEDEASDYSKYMPKK